MSDGRVTRLLRIAAASAAAAIALASAAAVADSRAELSRDCTATSPECPEIAIAGDPPSGQRASGYADPTLAHAPGSKRSWMVYSWISDAGGGSVNVETHLASSDDRGRAWELKRELWGTEPVPDPITGAPTHRSSEVASIEGVRVERKKGPDEELWFSARDRYVASPEGTPRISSRQVRVAKAKRPQDLAGAREQSIGVAVTDGPTDVDLTTRAPELEGCAFANPGLEHDGGRLYLALVCERFVPGGHDSERESIAVFSTKPEGPAPGWEWRYRGLLSDHADAVALGGEHLQAVDLSEDGEGGLVAAVTVAAPTGTVVDSHIACKLLAVKSLEKARLDRRADGSPRTLATVTASDLGADGPGTCSHDERSRTGIVIARRDRGAGSLTSSLHATGLRP